MTMVPCNYTITISRRTVNGLPHGTMGRSYGRTANGEELPRHLATLELGQVSLEVANETFVDCLARYPDHDLSLDYIECYGTTLAKTENVGAGA